MERPRVAIIIPALNEMKTIGQVVAGVRSRGTPIVVDDGSTDETAASAAAQGATVVRHEHRLGYDQALNSGFARARELRCEYLITMDADGQHDPQTVAAFLHALDEGAHVVVGVRDRRQRLAEHVFAWVGSRRWDIRDPLCGMKAYRAEVYDELGHFDSYGSIGTELAIFAARRGRPIAQVPVKTRHRMDAARFGRRFSANRRILRALWLALAARERPVAAEL